MKLSAGRQLDVRQRPAPALGDRQLEHPPEPVARDDELLSKGFVAIDERTLAGQAPLEVVERALEVRLGMCRRHGVVQRLRFLVERELRPDSMRTRDRSASS